MLIRCRISVVAAWVLIPAAWAGAPIPDGQDQRESRHAVKLVYSDHYGLSRQTVESVRQRAVEPKPLSRRDSGR